MAFGTLGLGIAEFVMMAILPYIAADLHITIPTAGHLISAYALGVCAGAPLLTMARKLPLKNILLGLVAVMMAGNLFASLAPNYWTMMMARFISGLPHGAYFGVASIVAEKLADKGKGSEAVSIMIAGMTIANLFGVPLGTSLSTLLSWRLTFLLVGVVGDNQNLFIRFDPAPSMDDNIRAFFDRQHCGITSFKGSGKGLKRSATDPFPKTICFMR